MSAITLSNLTYTLPDGRPLLKDLSLTFAAERAGLVGRNGVGKTTLLKLIAGEAQPQSGSIAMSGRLAVLRQTAQPPAGQSIADLFGAADALAVLRRAEKGAASADELSHVDWMLEPRMAAVLTRVGLDAGAETQLDALSGGQRTRAALASLLFAEPDFLLLDEPTNNLDADGRDAVIELLADWRGGAIVVSHDRDLLEEMDAIVELTTLGAKRYGGGWSAYRTQKDVELAAAEADLADAEKRVSDVARGAQIAAERKARKDRMGRAKAMRGDMPAILIGALKERSENTSAGNARMVERRRVQAEEDAASARARIEVLQKLAVSLPRTHLAASKVVLELEGVTAGYDVARPILRDVSFKMVGPERVAVVGPNGSGKTTLLAVIAGKLAPWRGAARVRTHFAMFDQDVSLLDRGQTVLENFRRINPEANENACRAALARFMFRADAAHQLAATLSGGQLLRAGLACVLGGSDPPPLLILDEPTNHLDVDSIEAIERALAAYDGALLVVSHDEAFLRAIGVTRRLALS
jgi:ATPase subunit of ABC transporter with duplicated ATPase domains